MSRTIFNSAQAAAELATALQTAWQANSLGQMVQHLQEKVGQEMLCLLLKTIDQHRAVHLASRTEDEMALRQVVPLMGPVFAE